MGPTMPGSSRLACERPRERRRRALERAVDLFEAARLGARLAESVAPGLEFLAAGVEHAHALVDVGVGQCDLAARVGQLAGERLEPTAPCRERRLRAGALLAYLGRALGEQLGLERERGERLLGLGGLGAVVLE